MQHFTRSLCGRVATGLAAFIFAAISTVASAQDSGEGPHPPRIKSIAVEYSGPVTLSKERILAQMRTAVGQPYSDAVAEQDIRALYATGQVQNVRIFGAPEGDGIKVTVAVQTRPIVNEIQIDGAERIKAKALRKDIAIKINQPAKEDDLEKGRQKIIERYQAHGFTDVDVKFHIEPIDEKRGTSRVVYTITEGVHGAVDAVRFEGNEHFPAKVLRKQMKTRGKWVFSFIDKSGRLDEAQLQLDLTSIREFYQNHGYMDVQVNDVRKERPNNGQLQITIGVIEGPQYHVGRITASGYKATSIEKLHAVMKVKEGDVYSPKAIHDDAKAIADNYGTGGYVDLNIVPQNKPAGAGRIDVHYQIQEGDRSFVQRINIIGNTRTKDKVIRREVLVSPGDVFNTVRVDVTKKRLDNLGFFSKVETYPEDTTAPSRKDLVIQVEEKRTGSLNFGAGFSTVDSLVGFVELTQGNFDILNWPYFTGGGEKFRMRIQYGTTRQDFEIGLTEPWFLDRRLSLGGQAFYHEASYLSSVYNQRNYGFAIEARKPLGNWMAISLGYRLDNIEVFDVNSDVSQEIRAETTSTLKSQVTTGWVFDHRDNPFLTRRGQRVSVTGYVAGGPLGGNDQIYGFDIEGSQYFHLPWDLILLLNAEVAAVNVWGGPETQIINESFVEKGPDGKPIKDVNGNKVYDLVPKEVSTLLIYDRLFLGGSNNLRGFNFRDVGPKDKNGEPVGGLSMARGTVEVTFPIVVKARGAIFYDTGMLSSDPYTWDGSHYASDVGIGLRLDLPIGPLRVDYGIPIERDGNKSGGKFNFNVGYQF